MTSDWSEAENESVIASYLRMLVSELKGEQITKAAERKRVVADTGRTAGAVEYKYQNISAAMVDLGLPRIQGYKPARNYQRKLLDLTKGYMSDNIEDDDLAIIKGEGRGQVLGGQNGESNDEFSRLLWSHAYGGSEVAARPSETANERTGGSITGRSAAGVDKAAEWFKRGIESDGLDRYFLFLIGGPGGGKSAAAARITENYDLLDPETMLAERSYRYRLPSGMLTVINDATIPLSEENGNLVDDIQKAIDGADDLLVCANRGVIVDDLGTAADAECNAAYDIVRWLDNLSAEEAQYLSETDWHLSVSSSNSWSYCRQARLDIGGHATIRLTVVYLDECSLLEDAPKVTLDGQQNLHCPAYQIQRFDVEANRESSSAASLLAAVSVWSKGVEYDSDDPRAANINALNDERIRNKVLSVLRASEIASNRNYSYRDLWALVSRLNTGWLAERQRIDKADVWVDGKLKILRKSALSGKKDPKKRNIAIEKRWEAAKTLGEIRFFMAPFLAQTGSGTHATFDQLGQMMRSVDPATDAPSGEISDRPDAFLGWSTPVHEAFSVVGESSTPLRWIAESREDSELDSVISPFDTLVDEAFVEVTLSLGDKERRSASRWYGKYLLRLYGVAHGIPGTLPDVVLWTEAWRSANDGKKLHDDVARGLNTLLLPRSEVRGERPSEKSIVPTFASRVQAVRGSVPSPLLVTELDTVDFKAAAEGDRIWVDVLRDSKKVGRIRLDLALVRLIRTVSGDSVGITEQAGTISPRLERVLASILKSAASDEPEQSRLRVVSGSNSSRVLLGECLNEY